MKIYVRKSKQHAFCYFMVSKTIKYIRFTPCALPSSDTSKNKIKPLTSFLTNRFKQWETIKIKKIYTIQIKSYTIQKEIIWYKWTFLKYKWKLSNRNVKLYNINWIYTIQIKKKLVIINEK